MLFFASDTKRVVFTIRGWATVWKCECWKNEKNIPRRNEIVSFRLNSLHTINIVYPRQEGSPVWETRSKTTLLSLIKFKLDWSSHTIPVHCSHPLDYSSSSPTLKSSICFQPHKWSIYDQLNNELLEWDWESAIINEPSPMIYGKVALSGWIVLANPSCT